MHGSILIVLRALSHIFTQEFAKKNQDLFAVFIFSCVCVCKFAAINGIQVGCGYILVYANPCH